MSFSLSPSVNVTEIDLTTVIPAVATTNGALVGDFRWGPCLDIVSVNSEDELVSEFGRPDRANAAQWFTAASFLAYGNLLQLVRVVKEDATNAHASVTPAILVKNDTDFDARIDDLIATTDDVALGKYPGSIVNNVKVSLCPYGGKAFFASGLLGFESSGVTLTNTTLSESFQDFLAPGSIVVKESTNERRTVVAVPGAQTATLDSAFAVDLTLTDPVTVQWEYYEAFGIAPSTSTFAANKGGSNDEVHVVVVDSDGHLTGIRGSILEKYGFVSKLAESKKEDGSSNYFKEVINRASKYVRILQEPATGDWVNSDPTRAFALSPQVTELLVGGANGATPDDGDVELGYDLFKNAEIVDVSLIMLANHSYVIARYVIENICEVRKDCVAFVSPTMDAVVNADPADLPDNIITERNDRNTGLGISSSYAVMDCNWKYTYDKYNDTYRWVPLNGDIAGLCVRTDNERDPWWSPAGLNRGQIKNVVKLAYNPMKADRDQLYVNGINPVVSLQGQGVVLYGDKTLLSKPSAFDRINVRRLFIVLEKAIATAAKYFLFEFNDTFTRAQFRNMVEPYLRRVQAARGVYDYRVVCDETNNTPEIIDSNQFVGDIYIKPARVINFIQLNFIAVRTGVAFDEIVGKF